MEPKLCNVNVVVESIFFGERERATETSKNDLN